MKMTPRALRKVPLNVVSGIPLQNLVKEKIMNITQKKADAHRATTDDGPTKVTFLFICSACT
jgi:hypothetical protein